MVLPRTDIGDPGSIAMVRDTEGNVVGLHIALKHRLSIVISEGAFWSNR